MKKPLIQDQIFIRKLTDIILVNLGNENFGVKELAHESGTSRYTISLRLRKINKKTINQFIREVRLQKALEMLHNESYTVSEVAYKVGFNSSAYFNKCFHDFFGYPPGKIKNVRLDNQEEELNFQVTAILGQKKSFRVTYYLILAGIVILVSAIITIAITVNPKIFKRDTLDYLISSYGKISIAVMPFQNMTSDTIWNAWQEGIQNELIIDLTNTGELIIKHIKLINSLLQSKGFTDYASITPAATSQISQRLDANVLIYGSIKKAGTKLRVNAQLMDPRKEESFKSFQIESPANEELIFRITDSLSMLIKNFLIISNLQKEEPHSILKIESTNSPLAYRYFFYGDKAFGKLDFTAARDWYLRALEIDSNFVYAAGNLAMVYANQGMFDQAKKLCLRFYKKRELMSLEEKINTDWEYAYLFETPNEQIKYLRQILDLDGGLPADYMIIGMAYLDLHQYDKAIPELEKVLEIYKNWGSKPFWIYDYTMLGFAYHKTGHYIKEKKIYKKAERDFPNDSILIMRQAILALTEKKTITANEYLKKYTSVCKNTSKSEVAIYTGLASVYSEAGIQDKAEDYYRKALLSEPERPDVLNNLAYFLIDKNINVSEGLKLINRALEISPDNYAYLHCKGWGLYKQGKYNEALQLLEKSWKLKNIYDHDIYLHINEVKKTIAGKN